MKEERRRWVMPKFLPHKYDVKLISEDKVCILWPTGPSKPIPDQNEL